MIFTFGILALVVAAILLVVIGVVVAILSRSKNAGSVFLGLACLLGLLLVVGFFFTLVAFRVRSQVTEPVSHRDVIWHEDRVHMARESQPGEMLHGESRLTITSGKPRNAHSVTLKELVDAYGDVVVDDSHAGPGTDSSDGHAQASVSTDETATDGSATDEGFVSLNSAGDSSVAWELVEGDHHMAKGAYSTRDAATRALATLTATELFTHWPEGNPNRPEEVYVYTRANSEKVDTAIFVEQLRKRLSPVRVVSTEKTPDLEDRIWLRVYLVSDTTTSNESKGVLKAFARNLDGPGELQLASADYAEKLWFSDVKLHGNRYRLARSDLRATQQAAREQAIEEAANVLFQQCDAKFGHDQLVSPGKLKTKLAGELERGHFVRDSFSQELVLPDDTGTVWRCALLVDPDHRRLSGLVHDVRSHVVEVRQGRMTTTASTFGFFVVLLALYGVLNAATRGYYTWVLRGAALLIAVSVVTWVVITWT